MAWKLDPTKIRTADIWETTVCPLARFVRLGLKKRGFSGHFTVVYSTEKPNQERKGSSGGDEAGLGKSGTGDNKRAPLGSAVQVTAAAGMVLASLVIRDLCGKYSDNGSDISGEAGGPS